MHHPPTPRHPPTTQSLLTLLDEHLAWQLSTCTSDPTRPSSRSTMFVDWDGEGEVKVSYRDSSDTCTSGSERETAVLVDEKEVLVKHAEKIGLGLGGRNGYEYEYEYGARWSGYDGKKVAGWREGEVKMPYTYTYSVGKPHARFQGVEAVEGGKSRLVKGAGKKRRVGRKCGCLRKVLRRLEWELWGRFRGKKYVRRGDRETWVENGYIT